MFSHHIIAAFAVVLLAVVLFGSDNAPSNTLHYHQAQQNAVGMAGAAMKFISGDPSNYSVDNRIYCFPKYKKSAFVKNAYCIAQIEVGPVKFHRSYYHASSEEHCSYILSRQVRDAMNTSLYKSCLSGELI